MDEEVDAAEESQEEQADDKRALCAAYSYAECVAGNPRQRGVRSGAARGSVSSCPILNWCHACDYNIVMC